MEELSGFLRSLEQKNYVPSGKEFDEIGSILSGKFSTKQYLINVPFLFRARKNWDNRVGKEIPFFKNAKELWCPDPVEVEWYGRCNYPRESLLYLSDNNIIPFLKFRQKKEMFLP